MDADTYERAAELIEERGWRQGGAYGSKDGRLCAVLAIREAMSEEDRFAPNIIGHMQAWLGLPRPENVIRWNDHRDRTMFDVTDALRHVAKELRNVQ